MDEKPTRNEDEYFHKHNAELIKQLREKHDAERARAGATAPAMTCPRCGGILQEKKADSVLLDECAQCHGVWLDAGELEILRQVRGGRSFIDSLLGRDK